MFDSDDGLLNGTRGVIKKRRDRDQGKWSTLAFYKDSKLVLMKFNNDQVHNQSDVHQVDYLDENQNYNIEEEIENVNHNQTNKHGSKKYLIDGDFNNFSGTFNNAFRVKHKLNNEYWELAATGDKESPLQKYYRLKFETEELLEEIGIQKGNKNNKDEKLCTNNGFQINNIFQQLLNYSINGLLEMSNDLKISETYNFKNCITNAFLDQNNTSQLININSMPRLNKIKIDQLSQISKVEECVQKLETIIGYEKSVLKHLGGNINCGLLKDVDLLQKLSKFNLPQMKAIEIKSIHLLPKLKQITTALNYKNLEKDSKINKLYEFILQARRESHLLPNILHRMAMLEIINQKVGSFAVTINNIKAQNSETSAIIKKNEQLLVNIITFISKNIENIFFKLHSLNARIEVIADLLKNKT